MQVTGRRRHARYQAPKRGRVVELHGLADVPLAVVEPTVDRSDRIYTYIYGCTGLYKVLGDPRVSALGDPGVSALDK